MQADKEENDSNGLMFIISAALFIAIVIGAKKFKPEIVNGETVIALVMIFISIIIYLLTLNFEAGKLSGSVGPSSIPRLWSIILAAFSIRLIFKNFRNPQIESDEKRNSVKTIGLIFLMATYLLIMNYLGYYISTGLFLILGMIWMNFKNYLVIALTTGGFLLMSYYVIQTLLQVPLPEGLLFY